MPSYNGNWFSPPAPLATVALRHPETGETVGNVAMLIDTGADVSLVPTSAVDQLPGIRRDGEEFEVTAFDGTRSTARAVQIDLLFSGKTIKGRVLLIDQEWGVWGRNVLNRLSLVLDGPQLAWRETQSSGP